MSLSLIASRALGKTELFVKKNAPTILTGIGVAGFATTTVLVGRAVLKSQPVVSDLKRDTEKVSEKEIDSNYHQKDKAREVGELYVRASVPLLKIYGPAITVGSASVLCILAGHGLMRKNQTSLLAAYAALDAGFKAYRSRVREDLGDERELDIYRGRRRVKGDDGVEVCEIIDFQDEIFPSPYARFFDETNQNWSKTPEYSLMFLRGQQDWANDRLRAHGFVFLNEVYEAVGLPRTQAGQLVGWTYKGPGDGYVDFGLYEIGDECARAFINGIEHSILLDFNVDGPIAI